VSVIEQEVAHGSSLDLIGADRDIIDHYTIGDTIGQGSIAKCKIGYHKVTGESCAIKILERDHPEFSRSDLRKEIDMMRKVKHQGCIQLFDVFENEKHVFIVLELASGGELFDRVIDNGTFSERDAAILISQVLEAVAYLHGLGICHRDLKPENVLMKSDDSASSDYNVVKLADFGLSTMGTYQNSMHTACGTPEYVAPEIVASIGTDKLLNKYSAKVDVWAIGVILYVMLCGFQPFQLDNQKAMYDAILGGQYGFPSPEWDPISREAKNFIAFILQVNPKNRPTAQQCLQHRWIREMGMGRTESLSAFNMNLQKQLRDYYSKRKHTQASDDVASRWRASSALQHFSSSASRLVQPVIRRLSTKQSSTASTPRAVASQDLQGV